MLLPPPFVPAPPCLPGMLPQPRRYLVRFSAHKLCRREPVKQRIPPKLSVHCPVEVKQSVSKDAGIGCDEMQRGELTFYVRLSRGSLSGAHLPPLCARGRSCSSVAWLYSDSTSHGRTNGDSRWPWKEQPRPGGHAGKSDDVGSLLSMSVLAPIRARGAHALASAQLLFRGLAVSDSTSHGGTMGDSRGRGRSSGALEGTRHV